MGGGIIIIGGGNHPNHVSIMAGETSVVEKDTVVKNNDTADVSLWYVVSTNGVPITIKAGGDWHVPANGTISVLS